MDFTKELLVFEAPWPSCKSVGLQSRGILFDSWWLNVFELNYRNIVFRYNVKNFGQIFKHSAFPRFFFASCEEEVGSSNLANAEVLTFPNGMVKLDIHR